MNEKNTDCSLCGNTVTHECGDDYLCDRCCTNIMSTPDAIPWLFDWLDKVVLPYSIHQKLKQ